MDTVPKWKDPKTGQLEGLSFEFNLCEAVATGEQERNSITRLTREFIDALPVYQMDGRTMHGVGSIKEYFLTAVRIKPMLGETFVTTP
ncbi:hypothetical protein BDE02_12G084700 [Populus trichocarpa]|nr:hypothetical protein BDE02_12G084700 [Populus trichocarpa]